MIFHVEAPIRAHLYTQLDGRRVAFNPVEPEPFDLVDLTKDVTNSTRIYHLRTECLREALAGANLIVADSQPLANAVRRVLPRTVVATLPFGINQGAVPAKSNEQPVVGLLNHASDVEMNNAYALKMLKSLGRELLVYGRALPGLKGDVEEDFAAFCARCDILLLPSLPGIINSTTLPLAVMSVGNIAILAHNAPGYYDLDAATGVQLLPNDPAAWQGMLNSLESNPAKLRAMQERNRAYAKRLNRDSFARLKPIVEGLSAPQPAGDCGCGTRKHAPTEPTNESEPIIEKEQ